MDWAEKYNEYKRKKDTTYYDDLSKKIELFETYKEKVYNLYDSFKKLVKGTAIAYRTQKTSLPLSSYKSFTGERKDIDMMILSDNENEIKFIPDGITFIGIYGKITLKNYAKIVTFQSVTEKRIETLADSCLYLIDDKDDINNKVWGFKVVNEDRTREIKKIDNNILEQILDDVFIR